MSTLRMPNINQVALSGRLVKDPDFQFLDKGSAPLRGRIAVNRSYRDRNDEWQEETSFFDVVLWQKAAETLAQRYVRAHRPLPPIACRATPGATMTTIRIRASRSRSATCKSAKRTRSRPTAKRSRPRQPSRQPNRSRVPPAPIRRARITSQCPCRRQCTVRRCPTGPARAASCARA